MVLPLLGRWFAGVSRDAADDPTWFIEEGSGD